LLDLIDREHRFNLFVCLVNALTQNVWLETWRLREACANKCKVACFGEIPAFPGDSAHL